MSLAFAIEPIRLVWNEFVEVAYEQWKETEKYRHYQPFNPLLERYAKYDEAGWFIMFTARSGTKLVGYGGLYIVPSMHTQQLLATEDSWFLLPEYRKGRNALNFYKFIEEEMRRRNVVEVGMTAKTGNSANRILEYLGYSVVSLNYSKKLLSDTDSVAIQEPIKEPIIVENTYVSTISSSRT